MIKNRLLTFLAIYVNTIAIDINIFNRVVGRKTIRRQRVVFIRKPVYAVKTADCWVIHSLTIVVPPCFLLDFFAVVEIFISGKSASFACIKSKPKGIII